MCALCFSIYREAIQRDVLQQAAACMIHISLCSTALKFCFRFLYSRCLHLFIWPSLEFKSEIVSLSSCFNVSDFVRTFLGNQTHTDHFKLLNQDGSSLLIGARNVVYNLSLSDLSENLEQRIEWNSRDRDTELCLVIILTIIIKMTLIITIR